MLAVLLAAWGWLPPPPGSLDSASASAGSMRSIPVLFAENNVVVVDDDEFVVPLERVLVNGQGDVDPSWYIHAEQDACALLGAAGLDDGEQLSLTLCDDRWMHDLNLKWRAVDAPTDVLSFPMEDPQLLGDLVISLDTATRQAAERSHELRDELRVRALARWPRPLH